MSPTVNDARNYTYPNLFTLIIHIMNKISTLLFAAAFVSPACMWAAEPVSGTATVELYTGKIVNINNKAFTCPNGPRTFDPNELVGIWTSETGKAKYNPDNGHYTIDNFLNGGDKCTLEFAIGNTLRKYDVYSTEGEGDAAVNTPLINPDRYDFEVFYKTADGADTYGLTPSQYTGYTIIPNASMTNQGWTHMIRINSANGTELGKFTGTNGDYYTFASGMRIYVTSPQRSATGTITAYEPVPAGQTPGDGSEAPSQAQYSYVVKDGSNFTAYLAVPTNGNNKCYKNSDTSANLANPNGMVMKLTFTKDTHTSGIEDIDAADENTPAEYYNLQGVRIENPTAGLYICRKGGKTSKVVLP